MMQRQHRSDYCHRQTSGWNEFSRAKPIAQFFEASGAFLNFSNNVSREKRRKLDWPRLAENIPQFLIVFAFHLLRELNKLSSEKLRQRYVRQRLTLQVLPKTLPTDECA